MTRLLRLAFALTLLGVACQEQAQRPVADGQVLEEGDPAPDFTLPAPDDDVSLADYRGRKPVLLYFSMGPG